MIKVELSKKTTIVLSGAQVKNLASFSVAILIAAFCLFGAKTLLSKALYQQRVISASHQAANQLNANITLATTLNDQYSSLFENNDPQNVLGAKNDSSPNAQPPNVDNARLALDALPTVYDYPATVASLTKIMTDDGLTSPNITGTDETGSVSNQPAASPQPVTITIGISGTGTYSAVQNVLKDLERSIRPFDVTTLQLSGTESQLTINATVNTYFQPAKTLGIAPQEVK